MTDATASKDQQTLLGIAYADQTLLATQIAMFAARTAKAPETLALMRDITDELSDRYKLDDHARATMKARIEETINLALAILGTQKSTPTKANPNQH